MNTQEIQKFRVEDLVLWTENPRDPISTEASDIEILKRAISDPNCKWNLQSFIDKMGDFYDLSEIPIVVNIDSKFIVYDGNKRIAIIKILNNILLLDELGIELKFTEEQSEAFKLEVIDCNLCDLSTALKSVERKHVGNGSWGQLERDYFEYKHLGKGKSNFIIIEEQTGAISQTPNMSDRWVKDEVLTKNKLETIGFSINKDNGLESVYDSETADLIFDALKEAISSKAISTRKNRGDLKSAILSIKPDLIDVLQDFGQESIQENSDTEYNILPVEQSDEITEESEIEIVEKVPKKRRTRSTYVDEIIFGKKLYLKQGDINNLYNAICDIYEKFKSDKAAISIIAMSMRLILEIAARAYYKEIGDDKHNKDQIYDDFLNLAKKEIELDKIDKTYYAIVEEWISSKYNLEALLGKFAHGNISVEKTTAVKSSKIVGLILEKYFGR